MGGLVGWAPSDNGASHRIAIAIASHFPIFYGALAWKYRYIRPTVPVLCSAVLCLCLSVPVP